MEEMFEIFRQCYYTYPLAYLMALLGLIFFSITKKPTPSTRLFRNYLLAYVLTISSSFIDLVSYFENYSFAGVANWFAMYADFLFVIYEYFVFAMYLQPFVNKKLLQYCLCLFIFCSILIILRSSITDWKLEIYTFLIIDAILLLPICISYFLEGLTNSSPRPFKQSQFFITAALTLYLLTSLPSTFILEYFRKYHYISYIQIGTIYYISYIILFSAIIITHGRMLLRSAGKARQWVNETAYRLIPFLRENINLFVNLILTSLPGQSRKKYEKQEMVYKDDNLFRS